MLSEVKAVVFIPLTQSQVTVIDFDDYEKIRGMKWCAQSRKGRFHAARYFGKKYDYLHRFLLNAPAGIEVDHRDGDGLNNQRYNLRLATKEHQRWGYKRPKTNCTSSFRGVSWYSQWGRWVAEITFKKKKIRLGGFDNEEDAARAYDAKARELFGEWASPNFPA